MKQRRWIVLFIILCLVAGMSHPQRAAAAEQSVRYIYASYTGGILTVGEEIPRDKIVVTAVMADGTSETVRDYTLSQETIQYPGTNIIPILYKSQVCNITIQAKKALYIYAYYTKSNVSVGNRIGRENLMVYAVYSDGTTARVENYTLENDLIEEIGQNTVNISFSGLSCTVKVYGVAAKSVRQLSAYYAVATAAQGDKLDREKLHVTALYTDGTTEKIYNYTLSTETVDFVGKNTIRVYYGGVSAEFTIQGVTRTLLYITAKYNGPEIIVGKKVDAADIEVTAYYDNGSKVIVKDFNILSSKIMTLGNNIVTISYHDLQTDLIIRGVEKLTENFGSAFRYTATNGTRKAYVSIAMPNNIDAGALTGKSLKPAKVRGVLGKLPEKTIDHIAFDILTVDETRDDIFPMTMRVRIPSYYKADQTALYYTTNRKTVIARMVSEWVAKDTLQVTIFHPGTYILAYQEMPEEENDDSEDDYL